jgi:hypothetical protein
LRVLGLKRPLQKGKCTNPAQQVVDHLPGHPHRLLRHHTALPPSRQDRQRTSLPHLLFRGSSTSTTPTSPCASIDLESLIGKLELQSSVIIAGRARLRRIRTYFWRNIQVPRAFTRVTLSAVALTDLRWWKGARRSHHRPHLGSHLAHAPSPPSLRRCRI